MSRRKKKPWDGPREKLQRSGAKSLTDVELLAIFLRTGKRGTTVMELAEKTVQPLRHAARLIVSPA